jgi:anti-anti-sigma factor
MALSITSRPDRNIQVLTVTGNLTLGPNLKSLQHAARAAIEATSPEALILDVSGLRYADSAGLGELTVVYSICSRKNCVVVLTGVPNQLRQMLDLTRLDELLPAASDIETARQLAKSRAEAAKEQKLQMRSAGSR